MTDNVVTQYGEVTLTDVKLASIFYSILVDLAKHKHSLTYGELIAKAKELHPNNELVQNAIPVGIGRRLEVVKYFTDQHKYPDLTCLVINKGSGEVGDGFHGDATTTRAKVHAFDWEKVTLDFDGFSARVTTHLVRKTTPKPKKPEAESMMYAYYKAHKSRLPSAISKQRDFIVRELMQGRPVDDVFVEASKKATSNV